jgi:hypothetical protein
VLESEPLDLRTDEMRWPTRVGSKGRREGEPTDEMSFLYIYVVTHVLKKIYKLSICLG